MRMNPKFRIIIVADSGLTTVAASQRHARRQVVAGTFAGVSSGGSQIFRRTPRHLSRLRGLGRSPPASCARR